MIASFSNLNLFIENCLSKDKVNIPQQAKDVYYRMVRKVRRSRHTHTKKKNLSPYLTLSIHTNEQWLRQTL